jgi:prenyltransferase beta subunit
MYSFIMSMKQSDGSFTMHRDGECDVRATYTAVCIASLLNILSDELARGVVEFVARYFSSSLVFSADAISRKQMPNIRRRIQRNART